MKIAGSLLIAALVSSAAFFIIRHENQINTLQPAQEIQASHAESRQINKNTTATSSTCPSHGKAFSVDPRSLRSIQSVSPLLATARQSALSDFTNSVDRANRGDAISALAVLSVVRGCRSIAKNFDIAGLADDLFSHDGTICKVAPRQLLDDPLGVLLPAARAGSNEAKLIYAINARGVANVLMLESQVQTDQVRSLLTRAEQFAEEAAQGGIEEAFTFLATAHHRGLFDQKKPVLAFAYASFVSDAKTEAYPREAVDHLYKSMSKEQVQNAKSLISACVPAVEPGGSILTNPF